MSTPLEAQVRAARNALPGPSPDATSVAEARFRAALPGGREGLLRRRSIPPRAFYLAAGIAIALVALGFGVGRWFGVPAGQASAAEYAPGFSPAEGWNTVSTGIPALPQAPTAIASNVPLDSQPGEGVGTFPGDTINGLSGDGVVIVVTLYNRGGNDSGFPPRSLPLQLSDATLQNGFEGVSPSIADERLEAGVGNWDLDVMTFFGTNPPTQAQLAAAQEELNRLVIPSS